MLSERTRAGSEAAPWVVDEIKKLEADLTALRRGNTSLLSALMSMVNQFFYERDEGDPVGTVLTHSYMSAEEEAIEVLLDAGMAEEVARGYVLSWDKLAERLHEIIVDTPPRTC